MVLLIGFIGGLGIGWAVRDRRAMLAACQRLPPAIPEAQGPAPADKLGWLYEDPKGGQAATQVLYEMFDERKARRRPLWSIGVCSKCGSAHMSRRHAKTACNGAGEPRMYESIVVLCATCGAIQGEELCADEEGK